MRDHFAILKVGPGATYALRETLWALAAIARELPGGAAEEDLRTITIETMHADPRHWRSYYHDAASETFDLQYSLSDRVRYYWPHPRVQTGLRSPCWRRLRRAPVPLTLLSQFLPQAIRGGAGGPVAARGR